MGDSVLTVSQKMQKLLVLTVIVGVSTALKLPTLTKEEIEEKFGPVNWSTDVKTTYCNQCTAISVESSGGALQYQPNRLGRFSVAGSLWENLVPIFKAPNGQPLTPTPIPSSTTLNGLCQKLLVESTQEYRMRLTLMESTAHGTSPTTGSTTMNVSGLLTQPSRSAVLASEMRNRCSRASKNHIDGEFVYGPTL